MKPELSQRIQSVEASKTVKYTALIEQLRREGRKILNLAVGEPHFEPPPSVIAATQNALGDGNTRYSAVRGLAELCEAIAAQYDGCSAENVQITNGAKQALYSIFQVICDPGDEVILPSPFWVSFSRQVELAGGVPKLVPTRDHQPDVAAIEAAITPRTAAIIINTPNNPTGAVYPQNTLAALADLAKKHEFFVISDEAYARFVYDGARHHSMFQFADIRDQVIVVKSFSKSFAMTGFRIGYAVGPTHLIQAMTKLQGHTTGNVCTFAQWGALAALSESRNWLDSEIAALAKKRDKVFNAVTKWWDCIRPDGAFYLFPDVSRQLKNGDSTAAFCAEILEKANVAMVPGDAFGMENHVRISYAVPDEILEAALAAIENTLAQRGRK